MPRTSPYQIVLSGQERVELEARARRYTSSYAQVVRAKIVLMAAEGLRNDQIASRLDTPRQVVSKWRKRFYEQRLAGLDDLPRVGRPPAFPPEVVVAIKALACELPATSGRPLSRWQCPDLARAAVEQGIVASISGTTVWRWLSTDAIKPWQHRSWIFPRDNNFAVKAGRILDLYARRWQNKPLATDEHVISTDEKTSMKARCRCHPTLPPTPGQSMRVEHEYQRKGALTYLAALDVHHARVLGRCEDTSGIVPFSRLVEQVMTPPSPTPPHGGCSSSPTTAPRTAARPPSTAWPKPGPPPARAPAHPRIVAQPDRDLLLDHPTQGPGPQRLPRPRHRRRPHHRLPGLLAGHRHAVRLEVHPHRP
jgi:transposase